MGLKDFCGISIMGNCGEGEEAVTATLHLNKTRVAAPAKLTRLTGQTAVFLQKDTVKKSRWRRCYPRLNFAVACSVGHPSVCQAALPFEVRRAASFPLRAVFLLVREVWKGWGRESFGNFSPIAAADTVVSYLSGEV